MFEIPEELIKSYIESRRQDLIALKEALHAGDIDPFHQIGHRMAGMAVNYGFPELEALGATMEALPAELVSLKGPDLVGQLERWLIQASER